MSAHLTPRAGHPLDTTPADRACPVCGSDPSHPTAAAFLRARAELAPTILDSMGDGLLVSDETGRCLQFDPAAERFLGTGPADAPYTDWPARYGLFLPDVVTPFPADDLPTPRAIRGEESNHVEVFGRNQKVPGDIFLCATGRPLRDDQGIIRGGVVVLRDTERKLAEDELRRAKDAAEPADCAKGESLANVSIVAMTAHARAGDRLRCLEAGMDAYVAKPLDAGELLHVPATIVAAPAADNKDAPAAAESADRWPVLNLAVALERVGGDHERLRELGAICPANLPDWLNDVRAAVSAQDAVRLRRSDHSIEGAASSVGGDDAAAADARLEERGRFALFEGALPDPAMLAEAFERLEDRLRQADSGLSPLQETDS